MYSIKPGGGDTAKSLNLQKRLSLIQRFVNLQGKKILDCGCGRGQYVLAFIKLGADAWGCEYEESKVVEYKKLNPQYAKRVAKGDIQNIKYNDNSFDIVFVNEVLEHVPSDEVALREISRILKPKGFLFIFSPNRLYPFETHGVYLKKSGRLLAHYVPFIPYIPLHIGNKFFNYWSRNYWPHELRKLINRCGLDIIQIEYVWQTFENISGKQPVFLSILSPILRKLSNFCERLPMVRVFGVSQFIVATKKNMSCGFQS